MIETHPFGIFVPKKTKYLLLGSFTGRGIGEDSYDWYYGTKRNQFWPMMGEVYQQKLGSKTEKQGLMKELGMAVGDIIWQCERKRESNLDAMLMNIIYNTEVIGKLLKKTRIEKIFFTSRWVETKFRKNFKEIIKKYPKVELITLPSPSPRYAAMRKTEKIKRYKDLLPSSNWLFEKTG